MRSTDLAKNPRTTCGDVERGLELQCFRRTLPRLLLLHCVQAMLMSEADTAFPYTSVCRSAQN